MVKFSGICITIFYFFILLPSHLFALIPAESEIRQFSLLEGLSQNSVYSIVQDKNGFIWFATEDGLNRFDGYSFHTFKHNPNSTNSLSNNSIYTLALDALNNIWIGTWNNGIDKFNQLEQKFTHFRHDPNDSSTISDNTINSIIIDKQGMIWSGTDRGINRINPKTGKVTRYLNTDFSKIYTLVQDSQGNLWAGGSSQGLIKINTITGAIEQYEMPEATVNPEYEIFIHSMAVGKNDPSKLYIGTQENGLFMFDITTNTFSNVKTNIPNNPFLRRNKISSIYIDEDGTKWIATIRTGLILLDNNNNLIEDILTVPLLEKAPRINCIYKSDQDLLWVGTNGQGAYLIMNRMKQFNHIQANPKVADSLPANMISFLHIDRDQRLWVAPYISGLHYSNYSENGYTSFKPLTKDNAISKANVYTINETKTGEIIFTTEEKGLYIIKDGKYTGYNLLDSPKFNYAIISVLEDADENIWAGFNDNGLIKWNRETNDIEEYINDASDTTSLGSGRVYCLFKDNKNTIWVGTEGGGLNKYLPETNNFKRYQHNFEKSGTISSNEVISIAQTNDSLLWVGTYGGGLNRFNLKDQKFTVYTEDDGLPNNVVYGILEDKKKQLWISTNKGIARFNPFTETFQNYDVLDGLQSNEFNSAYTRSEKGELFFGGINGITHFFPEQIKNNPNPPRVHLTKLYVDNNEINVGEKIDGNVILDSTITVKKKITLPSSMHTIGFEFTALNYINSTKNCYAYQLEGIDSDWVLSNKRRYVSYSQLLPGTYTFKVKASNNDGLWLETPTTITLTVLPTFWQTKTFLILAVLVGLALFYLAHLYRLSGIKEKNRELNKINNQLGDEINKRIEIQKTLLENEIRFRQLVHATFQAIVLYKNNKIFDCNQAALALFKYTQEQIINLEITELIVPDFLSKFEKHHNMYNAHPYRLKVKTKQNKIFDAEIISKKVTFNKNTFYVAAISDITRKLKDEKQKKELESQLQQSQKMEAIGTLAGGVAHDFNNLMTIINGFAELAQFKIEDNSAVKNDLEQIIATAGRASELTQQLLSFSRKQEFKPKVININTAITQLQRMLERLISANIHISQSLCTQPCFAFIDPGQLEQVIINLVLNARDAILRAEKSDSKTISISTTLTYLDSRQAAHYVGLSEGRHVCLTISDNGEGMSQKTMNKIFEPFFTTKESGKGTGLGLATVYGIVNQNNGNISVESTLGEGSHFKIFWPLSSSANTEEFTFDDNKQIAHGKESILLVEDDPGVRSFIESALTNLGYTITSAQNGKIALNTVTQQNIKFDLIITDLVMPEMNGHVLLEELTRLNYHFKVLVISGYSKESIAISKIPTDTLNFLPKPFNVQSLSNVVRDILDKN